MTMKLLYWVPRVIGILAILFMMMFSFDCLGGDNTLKEKLICFFMHNLPAFGIILILVIAWKWEMAGGLLFVIASVVMSIYFRSFNGNPASIIVLAPFLLTGILFILHDVLTRRKK